MVGEEDPTRLGWEVSAANPSARRRPGGYWNEDVLPVLGWEAAEYRVVLPTDLQTVLGLDAAVLRWSSIKLRAIVSRHRRDREVVRHLSRYLVDWMWCGEETGSYDGQYRVLFPDEWGRWYAVTIGIDSAGSCNVITVFGGSDRGFLKNLVKRKK